MARGGKDYDKKVRKVNKGQKSDQKIGAIHKMVEALISGDSDEAAEHLHVYLQEKTRDVLLGEKKEDKPDFADIDKDGDEDEDAKDAAKDKKDKKDDDDDKEDVKESVGPKANLTGASGPKWAKENVNKGKISGNSLRDAPKKSNDTKSKSRKYAKTSDSRIGKIEGDSLKKKPHKENMTKAKKGLEKHANHDDHSVRDFDDGRDRSMGTKD